MVEQPWMKSYPEGVRYRLEYPEVPAYQFMFEQVRQHPERTALNFMGKKVSYRELGDLVDRFAAALVRRFGIKPGDRVGIILPNCPQNVIATYGAQRAGAVPVQFNPMYVEREIAYQVQDSGCRLMVTLDLFWPKVKAAGGVEAYICTSVADFLPFPLNLLYPLKANPPKVPVGEAVRLTQLLRESPAGLAPAHVDARDGLAVLLYTGGTTGVSKGVMLTHRNFVANIVQCREWLQDPPGKHNTVMCVLPMFHSYGFTATVGFALATGSTCILVPRFDATEMLKLLHKHNPNSFPGVPTIYTALLQHPEAAKYPFRTDYCASGAAPMPLELMRRFEGSTGSSVIEGYGLTETSPVTHCNPRWGKRKPGSVGLPYPDTEVRIVDLESGADVPVGHEGEILLRGPQVMKGYWRRPDETAAVLQDGWLFTGDVGRMDEDGYLYIVDRKKDMIIAGGFNVYPREIEEIVYQHPAVGEACVVGVSDDYRGETVKVFVVRKPGAAVTEQEIMDHCKERLAAYKRPRSVEFVDALPKSAVGKILRRVLVQQERDKAEQEAVAAE